MAKSFSYCFLFAHIYFETIENQVKKQGSFSFYVWACFASSLFLAFSSLVSLLSVRAFPLSTPSITIAHPHLSPNDSSTISSFRLIPRHVRHRELGLLLVVRHLGRRLVHALHHAVPRLWLRSWVRYVQVVWIKKRKGRDGPPTNPYASAGTPTYAGDLALEADVGDGGAVAPEVLAEEDGQARHALELAHLMDVCMMLAVG